MLFIEMAKFELFKFGNIMNNMILHFLRIHILLLINEM